MKLSNLQMVCAHSEWCWMAGPTRKVNIRLPGKGKSNSHGARPVHLIIMMIKWIRTSRVSIKNSVSLHGFGGCHEYKNAPLLVSSKNHQTAVPGGFQVSGF